MTDVPVLAPAEEAPAGQSKKKWLIIGIAAVVVLGGGVGAWLLWPHADSHSGQSVAKAKEPPAPPLYVALDPPFVVNFEGDQMVRFLQVTVQAMTRDPGTAELLKANDPVVRNDLLLLLGNQKSAVVATREGKEHLRADALTAVRHVIETAGGKPDHVEAIYFTSFVMQ
ncbi:MAG: flagellar basal body-associated FliL family protein [Steroidobacteraceae bacterium]